MTDRALGVSLYAANPPRTVDALTDAVLAFYEQIGRAPTRLVGLHRDGRGPQKAFNKKSFVEIMRDERLTWLAVGSFTKPEEVGVEMWLRPRFPEDQRFESRWVTITGSHLSFRDSPVYELTRALTSMYEIAHGSIGGYRSLAYARQECSFSGAVSVDEIDPETRERLKEDQMSRGVLLDKLRRLYPITIVGPKIWAELRPLPKVDPPLVVEDLGPCKMLTAWPDMVEPRDPAFLAGTVELRRWLRPYTIQNPADEV